MPEHTRHRRGFLKTTAGFLTAASLTSHSQTNKQMKPDTIFHNGRITTLDPGNPEAQAMAVTGDTITSVGTDDEILQLAGDQTKRIDLRKRRVIPGLNDSHLHVIRAGLYYNMELRWDGVPTIAQALDLLRRQADRTPAPQWVRVIGGWNEFQFKEGRMPTLDEINRAAPDTPVFIMHLYDGAMLNRAALRALGWDASTPNPFQGLIARDASGRPTGLLVAEPNALILYSTIANAPKLKEDDQLNSTRHYMRELNRFGVTSASDAGGGGQNFPDDYGVIQKLADDGYMTVRIAYSLFAQKPGKELDDYKRWISMTAPGEGSDLLRVNGAGENLVWSAADFENFLQPRPDLAPVMEGDLEAVIRTLASNKWPFRIHATYDESIQRFLTVFERVHKDHPIDKLRWFFDHAETISDESIDRIAALGGGVAVQHRMAFQGEYYIRRYGAEAVKQKPPIRKMLSKGLPVGAGTDGTRVASYHPWTSIWWMVSGKTVGGTVLHGDDMRLSREEALRRYTQGSAWFSNEDTRKGTLAAGFLADFAVLSDDLFQIEEDEIRGLESVLTVLGGKAVHGSAEFTTMSPELPPISPDWSPVKIRPGYDNSDFTPPKHLHTPIMGADGRAWSAGCGCAF